ncbi:MAG: ATP synthase F1 subunit delta [Thermoanaerobaculales bacterium]
MARFRARPYAKALFQVINNQDTDRSEAVVADLEKMASALGSVPELHRVLVMPTVAVETKTEILDRVMDALEIREPVRRFLHVVQHHYRMQHMADIAATYRQLVDQLLGRTRAKVETAAVLDDQPRQQLIQAISAVEDFVIVADFVTKPELIAGFRFQVGSRVFDGSLAGELDRLSRRIDIEQG